MSNNSHHFVSSQEFCTGCGKTKRCQAIVETSGRIDCWCEKCWDEFLGLAYKAREQQRRPLWEQDESKTVESTL